MKIITIIIFFLIFGYTNVYSQIDIDVNNITYITDSGDVTIKSDTLSIFNEPPFYIWSSFTTINNQHRTIEHKYSDEKETMVVEVIFDSIFNPQYMIIYTEFNEQHINIEKLSIHSYKLN